MNTPDERLIQITPAPRQLALQEMEFYAFVHFTVNTFTDREWGDGTENPSIFNPAKLDAEQWVRALKDAGMKGLILTCKDRLIHYYAKFGYKNMGVSESVHGGAVWYDMILEFGDQKS